MRKQFEMTQEDLDRILDACKPVPYMVFGGMPPRSPQENANAAWAELGSRLGFEHMTVQPSSKGDRFFTAEPSPAPEKFMNDMQAAAGGMTQLPIER